jgi:glycosyltransferase involved in cell wall biosynthesis
MRAAARADLTLAVSDVDRDMLAGAGSDADVQAISTGVDTSYFQPGAAGDGSSGLAFVGSMDWYPNEDAVLHFLENILPRIRRQVPDVPFSIIGRNPSARIVASARAMPNVHVTGTVDDVRPHIASAAVCVVPLRIGGGTRLKIFEALAMGKAVVSTSVGAEGLPLDSGEHFVRADDAAAFADAVVALLRDPAAARSLGAAGRELVVAKYSWAEVASEFESRCRQLLIRTQDDSVCESESGRVFRSGSSSTGEPSGS